MAKGHRKVTVRVLKLEEGARPFGQNQPSNPRILRQREEVVLDPSVPWCKADVSWLEEQDSACQIKGQCPLHALERHTCFHFIS